MSTRRRFIGQSSALLAGSALLGAGSLGSSAQAASEGTMLKRTIPSSGEAIPAIGMGTSGSFEIAPGSAEHQALKKVLKVFFDGGATLLDTAPTYGNAEDILGPLLEEAKLRPRAFIATKLSGVAGRDQGLAQLQKSLQALRTDHVELLQVHNLGDWKTQMALAGELKAQGKVKYTGITHYLDSAQDQLADVVQETKPDFLQINYSVTHRGAEKRLFPMAQDLGIAVLANRNFNDGKLFNQVKGKSLPAWAGEAGVTSWAQMFLKFVLSHDAVTAVIPATGKPERQADNLKAGFGPLLTAAQKKEIVQLVG